MLTVTQLGKKIIEKNKKMLMVCVYLEKAYDSVHSKMPWLMELVGDWAGQ